MNQDDISFVFKYIDDFIGAMKSSIMELFRIKLESQIRNLSLKHTNESYDGTVSYLDCLVSRNEDSIITIRWWQKECSSRQILNFHSHHPTYI